MTELPRVIEDNLGGGMYFDRLGSSIDMWEWAERFGDWKYKRIAFARVGRIQVSTVWLGLDLGFSGGPPLIFKTMCFPVRRRDQHKEWPSNNYQARYSTEQAARLGHERIVNQLRARGAAYGYLGMPSHRLIWKDSLESGWA